MTAPTTKQWLRTAVDRVSIGSTRLTLEYAGRAVRAVHRRVTSWPWWAQIGLALLLLYRGPQVLARLGERVHERVASGAWGGLLFTAALVWIAAAYRAGRDDWKPKRRAVKAAPAVEESEPDKADEEQLPEDADEEPAHLEERPTLPTRGELGEALARVGTPHAHIAVLAHDLGTTPEQVRETLDRCGVAVTDVRMRGRGVSTGIKGGSLPAPQTPSEGVVGAGQPANNNDNNSYDFYTVPDKDNPARTHVVWHDQ
ncbi:hypothetical protein ABZ864_40445 [Streptomyces sp. NPDC047082]|uniref:hypothetical protein n=1 Tax=Streptomyces sp. NPDC047082 TaxID=3155259 RepID=UPI0033C12C6C